MTRGDAVDASKALMDWMVSQDLDTREGSAVMLFSLSVIIVEFSSSEDEFRKNLKSVVDGFTASAEDMWKYKRHNK